MSIETNSDNELLCPSCGCQFLHHERVEIFDRGEDEAQGLHVTVTDGKLETDLNLKGNPSKRRHGMAIEFRCELCAHVMRLSLEQHKGNTKVSFYKTDLLSKERLGCRIY